MQNLVSVKRVGVVTALCLGLTACGPSTTSQIASAKELLIKGDSKAAVLQLKSALSDNPEEVEARFLLGRALRQSGDFVAAVLELKKAREMGYPPDLVVPEIARTLIAQGDYRSLVKDFGDVQLAAADAKADFKTSLATAYANVGQGDKVEPLTREAFALAPQLPAVKLAQAKMIAGKGEIDAALQLIDQVAARNVLSAEAYFLRGDILMRARRDAEGALAAYQQAVAADPTMVNAHVSIIGVEISRNKPEAAQKQLQAFKAALPKNPQAVYTEAQLAFIAKDYARTRDILEQLLRAYPDIAGLRTFAGATHLKLDQPLLAETNLAKALQLEPKLGLAREYLARTYLRLGQPDRALATLAPMIGSPQPSADALSVAGEAHLQSGNFAQAEDFFSQALKLKPADPTLRTSAALALLAKGRVVEAFQGLQAVADSDPGLVSDLAIVTARMRRGERAQALQAIDQIERKQPKDPQGPGLRGRVLLMSKDLPAARAAFEQALQLQPAYFSATRHLVAMDLAEQQPDRARQQIDKALAANPKNAEARLLQVDLRRRAGAKGDEISTLLKAAVAANPLHVPTRLAWINFHAATKDRKLQLAAAQEAVAALPDEPDLIGALGDAQFASNDLQQAIRSYSRIIAIQPRSELAHLRLVDITLASGDSSATLVAVRRGLEMVPESIQLRRRLVALTRKPQTAESALALVKNLQKGKAVSAAGYLAEGDMLYEQKKYAAAAVAYRKATERPITDPQAAPKLHAALMATPDKAAAEAFSATWLRAHPKDAVFRLHMGSRAIALGDYAQAERYLAESVALYDRNANALNNLAWVMAERSSKGSMVFAQKAVALAPGNVLMLDTLAKTQAVEDSIERAIATQQAAVQQAPTVPGLRLNLAKLYAKAGRKTDALAELDQLAKAPGFNRQDEVARLRKSLGV